MTGFAVVNPFTGEHGLTVPFATEVVIEASIARAHAARSSWGQRSRAAERAAAIGRVADLHEERREALADILVREMGKPRSQALGEVDFAAEIYRYYADNAERFLADESVSVDDGWARIRKQPLGVILGIMPWNFPLYQVARFAAPNLVLGNAILLKHAPQCPESALALQQIFDDAGVEDGAYVNVFASNEQISAIIADPRVQGVSITGSERAGAAVAEQAGRYLKKVVLELGGSDPFIVLGSGDLDATVESAVAARLDNNGQACNAGKRFVVVDHLYDAFVEKFSAAIGRVTVADPMDDDTELGPLSSVAAAERLEDQVARAVAAGATKAFDGGPRVNAAFPPVVLTGVSEGNDAYREEFFGPVAQVYRVADEAEAITVANATPFGLGSYVFTDDDEQALRVADALDAGMVFINAVGAEGAQLPFGGVKRSGTGRELGAIGIEEFMNRKLIRSS
ncbi:MAG TPA: NAD-dependent succinate-semialdehyde dehydrogenase [Galbitalea sp.]|jgi:succinate-semialdehyde dehydrogenase/glutarate-semialdehyde dehydrogenase